jgi:hypothetical protein
MRAVRTRRMFKDLAPVGVDNRLQPRMALQESRRFGVESNKITKTK